MVGRRWSCRRGDLEHANELRLGQIHFGSIENTFAAVFNHRKRDRDGVAEASLLCDFRLDRPSNRIRCRLCGAGRDGRRPSQKLPSTAILWHKTATTGATVPLFSLSLEGVSASQSRAEKRAGA